MFGYPPTSPRSLVYHSWVTLSATLLGFVLGALFGILLAVMIVHARVLEKSLLPWIICSQMVPILAMAPIFIVVLGAIGLHGLLPKSIISAYLCFFPVTIGMVKGLERAGPDAARSDAHLVGDAAQMFWKLRWPSAVPFLFASLKVAITISLVGAIVGELPTGAQAGIGARLLTGSYYGQTVQIWAALVAAAILAACLDRHRRRSSSAFDRKADGSGAMIWRRQAIGFWLAALGLLVALALPLSSESAPALAARPQLPRSLASGRVLLRGCGPLGGAIARARLPRRLARLRDYA